MAATRQDVVLVSGLAIVREADATVTPANDVVGRAATVRHVSIQNTTNLTTRVYLKLYNHAAPTVGTTEPVLIIPCPGNTTVLMSIIEGVNFGTAVSFACSDSPGTAAGSSPANDVPVIISAA